MEERRSNGFRVKPSFGQVLGFIQESEPLTLDLPNRKASIYTSSHFYLDDYPNAPEPVSETPLPHTSLNPAAAFETADEGYSGTPFPRPPREFTRPSFLPDSDDGGMDPGQALRNDGLNPPRPPTLGGRMRESGIQAAEAIGREGRRAAAAEERVGEPDDAGPAGWRRLAGQDPSHPEAAPGTGPPTGRSATTANHRTAFGSGAPAGEGGATSGGGGAEAAQDIERFASQQLAEAEASEGFASAAEAAAGAETEAARGRRDGAWPPWAKAPWVLRRAACGPSTGAGAALVGTAWAIEGGLNAAAHMWGATTGGGTDSDASQPSHATDVQTLNGMQESGAIDHFYAQEQRRRQQPQVFRIDTTESEGEPQVQPQQQIRARPVRRPRAQPTPFGINQVPIPVSSGSERVSRQSRGDRGPLGSQPSFDALRQASEPEAA